MKEEKNNNKVKEEKKIYLIRQVNSFAGGTDILGITDNLEYAKSVQSVFCTYEEVKYIKLNQYGNRIYD